MKGFFVVVSALIIAILVFMGVSSHYIQVPVTGTENNNLDDSPKGCTIFTVTNEEKTFYACNEDFRKEGPIIVGITPPTDLEYGSVRLGMQKGEAQNYEMAMNDQGLAWDINSLPGTSLNRHAEHPYSGWGSFLGAVTTKTRTVEEVIQLVDMFDLGDALEHCQLHVADSTGDAVIIGPGPDGEIAFTRKTKEDDYLVSTNFNRAIPTKANHPESYLRYDNIVAMLENISAGEPLTIDYLGSILEANHFESLITYTIYSCVFDTTDKIAYIYYLSDFDNVIRIDYADAFEEGTRWFPLTDLISEKAKSAAEAKYTKIIVRDVITMAAIVISLATVIGILITLMIRFIKNRKTGNTVKQTKLSRYFLLALACSCGLLSVLMFISHIYPPNIITLMRPESLYYWSIALSVLGFLAFLISVGIIFFHKRNGGNFRVNSSHGLSLVHILIGIPGIIVFCYFTIEVIKLFMLF